jgi:ABC-type phosphate/phosphonate transport system substrate-binding protein
MALDTEGARAELCRRRAPAESDRPRLYTATGYSAVVQALRAKRVDGLQVGVFTYLLAVNEADAEALAIYVSTFAEPAVYDPLLRPEYYSVITVKKGSGISHCRI